MALYKGAHVICFILDSFVDASAAFYCIGLCGIRRTICLRIIQKNKSTTKADKNIVLVFVYPIRIFVVFGWSDM